MPASEAAMENLEQRMARPIGPLPKSPVVVENNLCRRCAALALKMTSGSGINYPSEPKGQEWRNRLMFADMSSGNETNWQSFAYGHKRREQIRAFVHWGGVRLSLSPPTCSGCFSSVTSRCILSQSA